MKDIRDILVFGLVGLFLTCWLLLRLRFSFSKPQHLFTKSIYSYPFKSGDLILTCGQVPRGKIFDASTVIKASTGSHYNHTGIVYVEPYTRQVFVWELNGTGTRLAYLHDLMQGNPPHILAVRSLNRPIDEALLERLIYAQQNTPFNWDMGLMWYNRFLSIVPFMKGHQWSKQRSCAQLTTETYAALGVLDFSGSQTHPCMVFPADYARDSIDRRELPLANGYEFGPIVRLLFRPNPSNRYRSTANLYRP